MTAKTEQITTVKIFNQTYKIKSGDDPDYVVALADFVDKRMNELAQQTPTVDTLKVAILAAMYIADDLHAARRRLEGFTAEVESKVQLMLDQLEPLAEAKTSKTASDP